MPSPAPQPVGGASASPAAVTGSSAARPDDVQLAMADLEMHDRSGLQDSMDTEQACPNFVGDADRLLTTPDGSPTTAFRIAVCTCGCWAVCISAGTFFTPSIVGAVQADDPLLLVGVCGLVLVFGIGGPMVLVQVRLACRTHDNATLAQLGLTTGQISASAAVALRRLDSSFGWHKTFNTVARNILVPVLVCVFAVTGWGLHDPLRNRISALAFVAFYSFAVPLLGPWSVAARTASALIEHRLRATRIAAVRAVDEASGRLVGTPASVSRWEREVAEPCRSLMADLELLNEGYAGGVIAWAGFMLGLSIAMISLAFAPSLDVMLMRVRPWLPVLVKTICLFFGLVFCPAMSLVIASVPAYVSTQCRDLRDALNKARASDFSQTKHDRIVIIETALANANHGQGLGFTIMGTVVDKSLLSQLAAKICAGVAAVTPLIVTLSTVNNGRGRDRGFVSSAEPCAVATAESACIKACMAPALLEKSCIYNDTLAEILDRNT